MFPFQPVNTVVDQAGNLMVVSDSGDERCIPSMQVTKSQLLKSQPLSNSTGKTSVSACERLAFEPQFHFCIRRRNLFRRTAGPSCPSAKVFLTGEPVGTSNQVRKYARSVLARACPANLFYITDESNLRTWKAGVNADGSLTNFQLFAEQGGEGVTTDSAATSISPPYRFSFMTLWSRLRRLARRTVESSSSFHPHSRRLSTFSSWIRRLI